VGDKTLERDRPRSSYNVTHEFPALDALQKLTEQFPSTISYVLIWTPRYINFIPEAESEAGASDRECKAELLRRTASMPNVRVLDWSEESRPDNHEPVNFYDHIHYRRPIAERMEQQIAQSFATITGGSR
jgi:hypothetical protein